MHTIEPRGHLSKATAHALRFRKASVSLSISLFLSLFLSLSLSLSHRVDNHAERAEVHATEEARQGLHARVGLLREGGVHHQQPGKQRSRLHTHPPRRRQKTRGNRADNHEAKRDCDVQTDNNKLS